jgi:hypothetical protein
MMEETLRSFQAKVIWANEHMNALRNSLGNVEKHRHFNLITASVDLAALGAVDGSPLTSRFIHQGPIEDGTILASAHGQVDVKFDALFGVAFGQGRYAPGELVDEVVLRIERAVQDVLHELAFFIL